MGRMLGSFVMKNVVTPGYDSKRMINQLNKTAALALFYTPENDMKHWIKIGMIFQRFALTATKLNLNHSHLNSPCQIAEVREKMMNDLGLVGFPQLIIRLGYSQKEPFTFRRRIHDVLIN